jgi:hypothetical protein
MCVTAASGGSLLYDQCVPFAILKPKNRKTENFSSFLNSGSPKHTRVVSIALLRGGWRVRDGRDGEEKRKRVNLKQKKVSFLAQIVRCSLAESPKNVRRFFVCPSFYYSHFSVISTSAFGFWR